MATSKVVDGILKRLKASGGPVLELLQVYEVTEYEPYWEKDVRLYHAFVKKLIDTGHPARAFVLARKGAEQHPKDPQLQYLIALALARGGNISLAEEYLQKLPANSEQGRELKVELLSLAARLFKDRYARTNKPSLRAGYAKESLRRYLEAYELSDKDSFPGINAAAMALLAGDKASAHALARSICAKEEPRLSRARQKGEYWPVASVAEAHFLLGDFQEAAALYCEALAAMKEDVGSIAAMRRDYLLLAEVLQTRMDDTWATSKVGSVVVFAGHKIDDPSKPHLPVRFPADRALEGALSDAIRQEIEDLNATVGFCSPSCGADLLFAEQMLDRRKELNVVLPFHKEDFYRTSVDFGQASMARWRARCDAVLERATTVHYATKEPFLGDEVLFDFFNAFIQGLALIRAAQRGVDPWALVVLDRATQRPPGGSQFFLDRWTGGAATPPPPRNCRVIDLGPYRFGIPGLAGPKGKRPGAAPPAPGSPVRRQVKVMLFADVKGFSKLSDEQSPLFFCEFLDKVSHVVKQSKPRPAFANTWGDGLYVVFDDVVDCAEFALRLLERVQKIDFRQLGFAEANPLRVGIHAGPVYGRRDPIIKRRNFFGSHVNRAARIEPVTTPGCAFTSEQFAAALAVEPDHEFVCEFVGVEDLPKGFDRCPLYRLERR